MLVPRDWQCDIRVGDTWTKLNVGLYPFEQDFAEFVIMKHTHNGVTVVL